MVLRYFEADPLRAEMVRDPAKHRCSSYPYHGRAQDDPLLSPFPEWEELGPTQAERRIEMAG